MQQNIVAGDVGRARTADTDGHAGVVVEYWSATVGSPVRCVMSAGRYVLRT